MLNRVVVLLGLLGFLAWYGLVGGRQIDEADVRSLYARYLSAFDNGDAEAFCKLHDKQIAGHYRGSSRQIPVPESLDHAAACAQLANFQRRKAELEASTGETMYTNLELKIESVSIAADRRSAQVELVFEARIGTEERPYLDMRSRRNDQLTRSWGRARILRSNASLSFYR